MTEVHTTVAANRIEQSLKKKRYNQEQISKLLLKNITLKNLSKSSWWVRLGASRTEECVLETRINSKKNLVTNK